VHDDLTVQVKLAQQSMAEADRLIRQYLPFIKAQVSKVLKMSDHSDMDDALSIAMLAFHEAIRGYRPLKGAFLRYAALIIRSRLIDHYRREARHKKHLSLDTPLSHDRDTTLGEIIASPVDEQQALIQREATHQEIEELSAQLAGFGITMSRIAENCPRQARTLNACRQVLAYAQAHPEVIAALKMTGKLPAAQLVEGCGVSRKTLERHRDYLVALLIIASNGYAIIRGHLVSLFQQRGGASQ